MIKPTYSKIFGRKTRVLEHPDPSIRGLEGIIVDETLNTIVFRTDKGLKRVVKKHVVIEVDLDGRKAVFKDKDLHGRVEERTKRILVRGI